MSNDYQVGDLVIVREWDDICEEFGYPGNIGFMGAMREYCGRTLQVEKLNPNSFTLCNPEDPSELIGWFWSSDMVVPAADDSAKPKEHVVTMEALGAIIKVNRQ